LFKTEPLKLSIIIPTYQEEQHIAALVSYLRRHSHAEVIIADANSLDETLSLARGAGAQAFLSPQNGRAAQMNFGASLASGEILYFVHADTFPPPGFEADILKAVEEGFSLGRYRSKYKSNKWLLKLNAWFTRFDWFMCMGGDQTLFITKKLFDENGGFKKDMMIMEEYEFCARVRRDQRYKIFDKEALISARKYEGRSWFKVQRANYLVVKKFKKGESQQALVDAYRKLLG
jgi:rSAM/selenodomain-associated transferase 2